LKRKITYLLLSFLIISSFLFIPVIADPVIFSNGFESGDFSAWTGTEGSVSISSTQKYQGLYSCFCDWSGSYTNVYYDILPYLSDAYARAYFYISSLPTGTNFADIIKIVDSEGYNGVLAGVTATDTYLAINSNKYYTDTQLTTGQWHCIEVNMKKGAGTGIAQLWIDGVKVKNVSSLNLADDVGYSYFGIVSTNQTDFELYFDNAVISDSYIETIDVIVPSFADITSSSLLAGSSSTLSSNITDNVAVSFYVWSTNINGSWINGSVTAFSSNPVTTSLTLPISGAFYVKLYANDSSNNWVVSNQYNFTAVFAYVDLQARDKDGLNLPRSVTFSGTLPNGTAYNVSSNNAGFYSLSCSNGSLTVDVVWNNLLVKSTTTIDVIANETINLDTYISRLNSSTNYVLISINNTAIKTPVYTVLDGFKIDNINATSTESLVIDTANWIVTNNPSKIAIGGNNYDSSNWAFSNGIITFNNLDFAAYAEPTIEVIYSTAQSEVGGHTDSDVSNDDDIPWIVPTNSPESMPSSGEISNPDNTIFSLNVKWFWLTGIIIVVIILLVALTFKRRK